MGRVLCWFSCGAASALAAKLAVEECGDSVEVIYCDTLAYEHPDNLRFLREVERWIGKEIKIIRSKEYRDIFDVFEKTGWLVGPGGARCTVELKKRVRFKYQRPDDTHVIGYTAEEWHRAERLRNAEPATQFYFPLIESTTITKEMCHDALRAAGIEQPAMYRLGFPNNNCIGCVKGQQGYWNLVRQHFPEAFERMAKLERKMNVAINKTYAGDGKRKKLFLDELQPDAGRGVVEPDIECGVLCSTEAAEEKAVAISTAFKVDILRGLEADALAAPTFESDREKEEA